MRSIIEIALSEGLITENYGKTIITQIKNMDRWAIGAWGTRKMATFDNKTEKITETDSIHQMQGAIMSVYGKNSWNVFQETIDNSAIGRLTKTTRGGVVLKVNGPKHKGVIVISLSGKDLYDVVAGTVRSSKWKDKDKKEDIYFDDLINVIDGMVG